ncbi:MAG TPA: hypothetical protein VF671_17860 [Pseudomonas sp.]|uniref:hypothetical protein n=1 Tax=Pseudomonas sp. TaxID=306 RepID=UPI002ED9B4BA
MTFSPMQGIYSDARNFDSFIDAGVDPRTGTYSCKLPFPELIANNLMGPTLKLGLNYDPLAAGADIGIGQNWDLPLSTFDSNSSLLKLSTGASYKANRGQSSLQLPRNKVVEFRTSVSNFGKTINIIYKTGVVEALTELRPGLWVVSKIISPEGRVVEVIREFRYEKVALAEIRDESQRLLSVQRNGSRWASVTLWPDNPEKTLIYAFKGVGFLNRVSLRPDNNDKNKPITTWDFTYSKVGDHTVLSSVALPTGASEQVYYLPKGLRLPDGAPIASAPAVESYLVVPDMKQPTIRREYKYSPNNYLGVGGAVWKEGQDNLYFTTGNYEYSTTEILTRGNEPNRTIERTYNRFHLLLREATRQSGKTVDREINYPLVEDGNFYVQPWNFQLPRQVDITYYDAALPTKKRKETTLTEYDRQGNLLKKVAPSGLTETYEYYPTSPSDGSPKDLVGIVRWVRQKTVTPAPGHASAAPLITRYRYASLRSRRPTGDFFHVLEQQATFEGAGRTPVMTINYKYEDKHSPFTGRLVRKTETVGGVEKVFDYAYELADNTVITRATVSGKDDASSTTTTWQDTVTGNELRTMSSIGVVIATEYDKLGRVIRETANPGAPHQAKKSYSYKLRNIYRDPVEHSVTHANGAQVRTILDGLGREVEVQHQDIDFAGKPMRVVFSAKYDSFGQLIEGTHTDWLDGKPYPLVTQYLYDDWGNRRAATGPNGVTVHDQQDPVSLTQSKWRQGSGKTVSTKNRFGKDDKVQWFDSAGKSQGMTTYIYDGLGRCTQKTDALGLITRFAYDFADRLLTTVLPDGTVVKKEYVNHSIEDLATRIWVNDYMAGERDYDGLLRVTRLTVGGRTETFTYEGAQPSPAKHTAASGKEINYRYDAGLNNQVVERSVAANAELSTRWRYDAVHAGLIQGSTASSEQLNAYFSSGKLKDERFTEGQLIANSSHRYSLKGLPLQYIDNQGMSKTVRYDGALRMKEVERGTVIAAYTYDELGRVSRIDTRDLQSNKTFKTELSYDDFDREVRRLFSVDDTQPEELLQKFNAQDKLVDRTLSNAQGLLLKEGFDYDERGRLWGYSSIGPKAPRDVAGKQIRSQTYIFDPLDNVKRIRTQFDDASINNSFYYYENQDKTQLTRVAHSHLDYAGQNAAFTYDLDGNQLNDEKGRQLIYDELGRITSIKGAQQ